ncbi:hypothetical protein LDENG_00092100 [Lucifuga dentata]|nr:hypothetical protein LDENG_00092100 [Lucifuga dentata]
MCPSMQRGREQRGRGSSNGGRLDLSTDTASAHSRTHRSAPGTHSLPNRGGASAGDTERRDAAQQRGR